MTTDELERLLVQQPVARLHRLAHGRVHRHFRLGKQRLIEALLRTASTNRTGLESDLRALMEGKASDPSQWPEPFIDTGQNQLLWTEVEPGHFVRIVRGTGWGKEAA